MQQNITQFDFEFEKIPLPSKGLVYPLSNPLSKGFVEMRYMTAKHEDILTNVNKISKGESYLINEFAKSLIVDPNICYEDLIDGDSFQIILASRILAYGSKYEFKYKDKDYSIDLSKIGDKEFDTKLFKNLNEFEFILPMRGIPITIKILTVGDYIKIDEEKVELKKQFPEENFDRFVKLKYMIQSVDGNRDKSFITNFIENKLIGWDIRSIFDFHTEIAPNVDFTFTLDSTEGVKTNIPFDTIELFFPTKQL